MSLGTLLNLPGLQFPKDDDIYLQRILLGITDTEIYMKHVNVAYDKGWIYGNCYRHYYNPRMREVGLKYKGTSEKETDTYGRLPFEMLDRQKNKDMFCCFCSANTSAGKELGSRKLGN